MSYLHDANLAALQGADEAVIKQYIADMFWSWYEEHKRDVIARLLFITVRVDKLHGLFVMLFGPNPYERAR